MTADRPQAFQWNGEYMVPRSQRLADKAYCVGETYWFVPHEERSIASHNHEFSWLKDAWLQLPEALAELYPTPTHLRKRALVDAGFYNESITDAGSNAAALRVASTMRAMDEFALVIVRGPLVVMRRAKSQSRRAMGKQEFQDSKTAIIETISAMIGVTPGQLLNNSNSSRPSGVTNKPAGQASSPQKPAGNHSVSPVSRASGERGGDGVVVDDAPSPPMQGAAA